MQRELLEQLTVITREEETLLRGDRQIQKEMYADARAFVVDSQKPEFFDVAL